MASRLTTERGPRLHRPLSAPYLVGREEQRAALWELATSTPSVGVVEGQAGVGKTRLVSALAADAALAGRRVLTAACLPLAEPFPLAVLVSALGSAKELHFSSPLPPIAGALRTLVPEIADRLPPAPSVEPMAERHVRFRAMRQVLACIGPALCIVDDLHWCDQSSADFLCFLLADMPSSLSLVVTYRREDMATTSRLPVILAQLPARIDSIRVALEPLTAAAVGELIEAIVGRPVPTPVAAVVHRRTAGLPFAVEELLRLADDRGMLTALSAWDLEGLEVPATVRDSVLERAASLGPQARRLVEAAAVVDTPAGLPLLSAVADLSPGAAGTALAEALGRALLVEPAAGLFGLRHPLACRSVVDAIPTPTRRHLHRRAATALRRARPQPAARLAHHYREGGELRRWLTWAEAAARAAEARGDPDGAIRFLCDAVVSSAASPVARTRMADTISRVAVRAGLTSQQAAVEALRGVLEVGAYPREVKGRVRRHLSSLLTWTGDAAAGYDTLSLCLGELDGQAARIDVMLNLATSPHLPVRLGDRLAWLARTAPVAASLGEAETDLRVLAARASVLLHAGDRAGWDAARRLPSSPTTAAERATLSWAQLNIAWACIYLGYDRRAHALLAAATSVLDPSKQRFNVMRETIALLLRFLAAEWDAIDPTACLREFAGFDMPSATCTALQIDGVLALARGDLGRAAASLQDCADRAEAAGLARSVAVATACLARLHLRQGDPELAYRRARNGFDTVTAGDVTIWAAELITPLLESAVACGRDDEAAEQAREFAAGARGRDAPIARAAMSANRGVLSEAAGDPAAAAVAYGRAAERFARLGRPYYAAQAAVARGRSLLASGQEAGTAVLLAAHARLQALGACSDADEALRVETLRGHDGKNAARKGRPSYRSRLSPREREVVELAARGLTNAEIGLSLHISPRTVETHVAAAVRKLELPSKRALRSQLGPAPAT